MKENYLNLKENLKVDTAFSLFLTLLFIICFGSFVFSQNVGINATGATPDASAMLDIVSSNKGILLPRIALTGATDVTTISSPTTSLMVYNTATAGTSPNNVIPGYYYYNGTKWIAIKSPTTQDVVVLSYNLAAGTDGGATVATTWTTRALNTEVLDPSNICTLTSNQFTLPAGTYSISFVQTYLSASGVRQQFRSRIRNITSGSTTALGNTTLMELPTGERANAENRGFGYFTISSSTTFELQYYAQSAIATNGLGLGSVSSSGEIERFATVFIQRIAL